LKARMGDFDVEDHFGAYLEKETIRELCHSYPLFNKPVKFTKKERQQGIKRAERKNIKYEDFVEINRIFSEYLSELRGSSSVSNFVQKLYKAELTGARILVNGKEGIVVEERANSIIVVHRNDSLKTYIKRTTCFSIEWDGVEYFFMGPKMKLNRFVKK
jgi:hypothetical protein